VNLIIDKGNTFSKVFIFDNEKIVARARFETLDVFLLDKIFKEYSIDCSIYSHVGNKEEEPLAYLQAHSHFVQYNYLTPLPIINKYASPETLGLDRIAVVCAAYCIFPLENVLCIDMGTCITYDIINKQAEYLGGAISPGIQMRFKALHTFTAQLPLIQPEGRMPKLIGDSTENSIKSGVVNGTVQEIMGVIGQYQLNYPNLQVLMCGGDLAFFDTQLKNSIFARPDLVAEGLNTILQYNVQLKKNS
jgi:type III pantothenate kinase